MHAAPQYRLRLVPQKAGRSHARHQLNSIVTSVVDLLAYRIRELVQLKLNMDSAATSRTSGEETVVCAPRVLNRRVRGPNEADRYFGA
jgi:hypothetical protein